MNIKNIVSIFDAENLNHYNVFKDVGSSFLKLLAFFKSGFNRFRKKTMLNNAIKKT